MTTARITHLIAGSPWEGSAERTSEVYNPATGEVTGALDLASADLVDEVVAGAKQAWRDSWGSVSMAKRTQVLFKFRELLDRDKHRIAELITREHGKVLDDALGEVTRGLEVAEFACGIPHLLKGGFTENASTGVDVYSIRQSLGVVAVISPFNFPAMVPLWFVPVAVACGNAVVIKPSEKDPSATIAVAELWTRGRPPGRRDERGQRRQGGRGRAAGQPGRQGDLVRRVHADRPLRLRDRHRQRQARAGPRRRQEPHARAARCRPRPGRRRCDQRRLRLGRRTLHGDLRPRRGRLDRRRPRRQDQGPDGQAPHRRRHPRQRHGPARDGTAPREGGVVHRCGCRGRCRPRRRRTHRGVRRRRRRLLPRTDPVRPGDPGDVDLHRRDLRPRPLGPARRRRTTTGSS